MTTSRKTPDLFEKITRAARDALDLALAIADRRERAAVVLVEKFPELAEDGVTVGEAGHARDEPDGPETADVSAAVLAFGFWREAVEEVTASLERGEYGREAEALRAELRALPGDADVMETVETIRQLRAMLERPAAEAAPAAISPASPVEIAEALRPLIAGMIPTPTEAAPKERTAKRDAKRPACDHSPDFRSIRWNGKSYDLTVNQAAAVRILWDAWESGTPDVSWALIQERADIDSDRLRDTFRTLDGYKRLIVSGSTKGTYRLKV